MAGSRIANEIATPSCCPSPATGSKNFVIQSAARATVSHGATVSSGEATLVANISPREVVHLGDQVCLDIDAASFVVLSP